MVHVEHLVGLGDGAKQGVVAARTFLLLVESCGRAFGMSPGAQHRPIEVERYAREPFGHQALDDYRRRLGADFADAVLIGTAERAAEGGDVRQSLQAKHPLDQLIITVVVQVSQSSMSDDEMNDQQHHHDVVGVNRIGFQVAEASPQPLLDANEREEVLKENQSRVRCQILRLEPKLHAQRGFTPNIGSAKFHACGLRFIWYMSVWRRRLYQSRRPLFLSCIVSARRNAVPDSPIPRFPDSPIPRFPDSPIPGHLSLWFGFTVGEPGLHATWARKPHVCWAERILQWRFSATDG